MEFTFFVSSAVVSAIIAAIAGVITANISRKTARDTAQETTSREIEKLERTWDREDIVSSDEEFAEMASIVTRFVAVADGMWCVEAAEKVAAVRSKEIGEIGHILDALYKNILNDDFSGTEQCLTNAIQEKRRIKSEKRLDRGI